MCLCLWLFISLAYIDDDKVLRKGCTESPVSLSLRGEVVSCTVSQISSEALTWAIWLVYFAAEFSKVLFMATAIGSIHVPNPHTHSSRPENCMASPRLLKAPKGQDSRQYPC